MQRRVFLNSLAVAALTAALASAPAQAGTVIVHSDSGTISEFTLTHNSNGSFSLVFGVGQVALDNINGSGVSPALTTLNAANTINFTAPGGTAGIFDIAGATGLVKTINSPDTSAANPFASLVYDLNVAELGVGDTLTFAGVITSVTSGQVDIGADTYVFSNFAPGTVSFSLTGKSFTGGAGSLADVLATAGTSVTGTGSFSQAAAIPEPTSVALLGVGLAGLIAFRRRFSKRLRAAA